MLLNRFDCSLEIFKRHGILDDEDNENDNICYTDQCIQAGKFIFTRRICGTIQYWPCTLPDGHDLKGELIKRELTI